MPDKIDEITGIDKPTPQAPSPRLEARYLPSQAEKPLLQSAYAESVKVGANASNNGVIVIPFSGDGLPWLRLCLSKEAAKELQEKLDEILDSL
jgi:hypothetical protein